MGARRLRDLLVEETIDRSGVDSPLGALAVEHHADAGLPVVKRDRPAPALGVGFDEDIRLVGPGQARCALEIAVHGEVAEEGVKPPQPERVRDQAALTARVDDEARAHEALAVLVVRVAHPDGAAVLEAHLEGAMALAHVDVVRPAVLQQQLVKLGPRHLIRVRVALARLAEVPAPGLRAGAPDHRRAPLL